MLSWSQTGPQLVADLQQAGIRPITSDRDSVMEFGFESVCDQVRAGSSYLNMSRESSNLLEPGRRPVRSWSQPNYAILVADRSETGRRPVVDLLSSC